MRFPDFDLPTVTGARMTRADLDGRPWAVYLSRHPGCFVCQHHLARALALRPQLQALGGDVLVFFPSRAETVRRWWDRADVPRDLTVVVDEQARVYDALGTIRGGLVEQLKRTARELWQSRSDIGKWRLSNDDMLRMGADVAVLPDGELAVHHVCRSPADRADPQTLVDALGSGVAQPA